MSRKCIRLKAQYFPLVEQGLKRSTIRAGMKPQPIGPADLIAGEKCISVDITAVELKRFAELTEKDAKTDGFQTLAELKEALTGFYPNISVDDFVSILHFKRAT